MADQTTTKSTWTRAITQVSAPLPGGMKCYEGTRACYDTAEAGIVVPANGTGTTLVPLGRFVSTVDNSANASSVNVPVVLDKEVWCTNWDSVTGSNAVTISNLFLEVYLASNHEVTTSTSTSKAGRVFDVNADGVWICGPDVG